MTFFVSPSAASVRSLEGARENLNKTLGRESVLTTYESSAILMVLFK